MKSYKEIYDYLINCSLTDNKVYKNMVDDFDNIVFIIKDVIYNLDKKVKNDDYEMVIEKILLPRITVIKNQIERLIIDCGYDASKITSLCDKVEYINSKNVSCDEINKLYQEFITIRNGIWNYYLYILNSIMEKYSFDNKYDDIYQEAAMGLMVAIEKFDNDKYNFRNFAKNYINYNINYHYHDLDCCLKIPMNKRHLYYKMHKEIDYYVGKYHKMPTSDDLKKRLRITNKMLSTFLSLSLTDYISFNDSTYSDDEYIVNDEIISGNTDIRQIEDVVFDENLSNLLAKIIEELTDRERFVITNYYLVDNQLSYDEITEKLGVSYSTVMNARRSALVKLRKYKSELGKYLR